MADKSDWVEVSVKVPRYVVDVFHAIAQAKRVPHPDVFRYVLIKYAKDQMHQAISIHSVALRNGIPGDISGAWRSALDAERSIPSAAEDWTETLPGADRPPTIDVEKRSRGRGKR